MTFAEVTFYPSEKKISVRPGITVFDAARRAKIIIPSRCGGKASCLMCKVLISSTSGLAPIQQKEKLKLGSLAEEGYRLSCQAIVRTNCSIQVPEDRLKSFVREQLAKQRDEEENM